MVRWLFSQVIFVWSAISWAKLCNGGAGLLRSHDFCLPRSNNSTQAILVDYLPHIRVEVVFVMKKKCKIKDVIRRLVVSIFFLKSGELKNY